MYNNGCNKIKYFLNIIYYLGYSKILTTFVEIIIITIYNYFALLFPFLEWSLTSQSRTETKEDDFYKKY